MTGENETGINYSLVHPGVIIGYRLLPYEQPCNPNRIWKSRVIRWYGGTLLFVELLDSGYEGCCEYVLTSQIVGIVHEASEDSTTF